MSTLLRGVLFSMIGLGAAHLHPSSRARLQATAETLREVGQAFRALEASARSPAPDARPEELAALQASASPAMADAMPGFETARDLLIRR